MIFKIKGFGQDVYSLTAQGVIASYLKVAFWLSPFAFWKIYELFNEFLNK